jgi:hypothetical protein
LEKYRGAEANLEELRADTSITVVHGVDATKLQALHLPKTPNFCFDAIIWNFPYPAKHVFHTSTEGGRLLSDFFACAGEVLNAGGELRITMASRQGGSTREVAADDRFWDLEAVALARGFDLREVVPFDPASFPGYEPRRAIDDTTFPFKNARTYIFVRCTADMDARGFATGADGDELVASSGCC